MNTAQQLNLARILFDFTSASGTVNPSEFANRKAIIVPIAPELDKHARQVEVWLKKQRKGITPTVITLEMSYGNLATAGATNFISKLMDLGFSQPDALDITSLHSWDAFCVHTAVHTASKAAATTPYGLVVDVPAYSARRMQYILNALPQKPKIATVSKSPIFLPTWLKPHSAGRSANLLSLLAEAYMLIAMCATQPALQHVKVPPEVMRAAAELKLDLKL